MGPREGCRRGRELAHLLERYRGERPLILAVPRTAVPMAREVAGLLRGDLDVLLVGKLTVPGNPEASMGVVDETGDVLLDDRAHLWNVPEELLDKEISSQLMALARRRQIYAPGHPGGEVAGRTVIVVDWGAATGASLTPALRLLRRKAPARLVVALAVGPASAVEEITREADEVVCLETPSFCFALGRLLDDSPPISEEEVARILASFAESGQREEAGVRR